MNENKWIWAREIEAFYARTTVGLGATPGFSICEDWSNFYPICVMKAGFWLVHSRLVFFELTCFFRTYPLFSFIDKTGFLIGYKNPNWPTCCLRYRPPQTAQQQWRTKFSWLLNRHFKEHFWARNVTETKQEETENCKLKTIETMIKKY